MEKEITKETIVNGPEKINAKIVTPIEETVTLKKSELETIMARLERVESAAEKSRLARFDDAHKTEKGKVIRLRTIDGLVVLSWDAMLTNKVEKNPLNNVWQEDQKIRIHLEDKTTREMDLVVFNRHFVHLEAKVISETKVDNKIIFKALTEDGREYEIEQTFIN